MFLLYKRTNKVIEEIALKNFLYSIPIINDTHDPIALGVNHSRLLYHSKVHAGLSVLECLQKLGHPSPQRFQDLSPMTNEIPKFHIDSLRKLHCLPYLSEKSKQAPFMPFEVTILRLLEKVHIDISTSFTPTLKIQHYELNIIKAWSAKSDFVLLQHKRLLNQPLSSYVQQTHTNFEHEGFCIKHF